MFPHFLLLNIGGKEQINDGKEPPAGFVDGISSMLLLGVIFDDLIEHVLEIGFTRFLFANNLEFARKFSQFIVLVFHLDKLVEGLELIVSLIAPDDWLPAEVHLDNISLN